MGYLLPQSRTGRQIIGSGEPTRCLQAADRFEETSAPTLHRGFSPALGDPFELLGQVGGSCPSDAASDSQEMAYRGLPLFLAMEVM